MTSEDPGWQVQVDGPRCPFCHEALRGEDHKRGCGSCMAWHHAGCLRENGGRCAACRAEVTTPVDQPAPRFKPGSRMPALLDRYDPQRPNQRERSKGSGWLVAVLGLSFVVPLAVVTVGLLIPHASEVVLAVAGATALAIVALSAGRRSEPGIRGGSRRWGRWRRPRLRSEPRPSDVAPGHQKPAPEKEQEQSAAEKEPPPPREKAG